MAIGPSVAPRATNIVGSVYAGISSSLPIPSGHSFLSLLSQTMVMTVLDYVTNDTTLWKWQDDDCILPSEFFTPSTIPIPDVSFIATTRGWKECGRSLDAAHLPGYLRLVAAAGDSYAAVWRD